MTNAPVLPWAASPVKAVTFEGVVGTVIFPVPFEAPEPSPTSPRPTAAQAAPEKARISSSLTSAPNSADSPLLHAQSDLFSCRKSSQILVTLDGDLSAYLAALQNCSTVLRIETRRPGRRDWSRCMSNSWESSRLPRWQLRVRVATNIS